MPNPRYNDARGAAILTSAPPFDFDQVIMRVFPLTARMDRLSSFCDRLLNVVPPEIAVFRPSMAGVFFMAISYGRMESEVANTGWTSQHEFGFAVPLDWYRRDGDGLVFHDFATVFPYIFVDDVTSQVTGREVYGWPKVQGWLTSRVDSWTRSPVAPREVLCLRSTVLRDGVSGEREQARVVIEVFQEPQPSVMRMPRPDNPSLPWLAIPNAITSSLKLATAAWSSMLPLPIAGHAPDTLPPQWPGKLQAMTERFGMPWKTPMFDTVNFKQFRDAEDPDQACYQALVGSEMSILRVNDGGVLGEEFLSQGDVSGGYSIKIHRHSALPVIETLGLDVVEETGSPDARVATLRPTMPTWSSVDMRYGVGEVICWRTRKTDWTVGPGLDTWLEDAAEDAAEATIASADHEHPDPAEFNVAQGAAQLDTVGEEILAGVVLHVLPLLATPAKLQAFCDAYLNANNPQHQFEALGSYVYLVFENHGGAGEAGTSPELPLRGARFAFPVAWKHRGEIVSAGLVSPYAFYDSQRVAETMRELHGCPAELATLEGPPNAWLSSEEPPASARLTVLRTQLLTNLNRGERKDWKTLLEVVSGSPLPPGESARWREVASTWGRTLLKELRRKQDDAARHRDLFAAAKALAFEILAHERPINDFTLKQFRDATDVNAACYQALVVSGVALDRAWDLREIEAPLHVRMHVHASMPIVKTLGLAVKLTEDTLAGPVHVLEPLRPFFLRADLRTFRGENLAWRAGSEEWNEDWEEWQRRKAYFQEPAEVNVGPGLIDALESGEKKRRDAVSAAQDWRTDAKPEQLLSLDEAKAALTGIDPHAVIESLLSREWQHQGNPRWYRKQYLGETVEQKPEFCVRRDSVGPEAPEVFRVPLKNSAFRSGPHDSSGWFPVPESKPGA